LVLPRRGKFPGKEGAKQVLAGLAPFSQTIAYLLRIPARTIYSKVLVKPKRTSKNSFNLKLSFLKSKSELDELISIEY
jgi:hypothetical protein